MANVLNRTTRQFIASANTPDYPVIDWIVNPDLLAVVGFGPQYWVVTGDVVSLMDAAARALVDATALTTARDATAGQLGQTEDILRGFMLVVLDEFNLHALKYNAVLDAIDAAANLADLKTRILAIADYPQRTDTQLRSSVRGKLGR